MTWSANRSRSTASAAPAGTRVVVCGPHDDRAQAAHLVLEDADRVIELVAAKGIAADQFREAIRLVNRGRTYRAHLVEHDWHAKRSRLPGGLAAGQTAADDANHENLAVRDSPFAVRRSRFVDSVEQRVPSHQYRATN